jgi:hypothetical protein
VLPTRFKRRSAAGQLGDDASAVDYGGLERLYTAHRDDRFA